MSNRELKYATLLSQGQQREVICFLFNLPLHYHTYIIKSIFTLRDD